MTNFSLHTQHAIYNYQKIHPNKLKNFESWQLNAGGFCDNNNKDVIDLLTYLQDQLLERHYSILG